MDRYKLYFGAATLIALGFYYKVISHVSVGLGLMWVAISIKKELK